MLTRLQIIQAIHDTHDDMTMKECAIIFDRAVSDRVDVLNGTISSPKRDLQTPDIVLKEIKKKYGKERATLEREIKKLHKEHEAIGAQISEKLGRIEKIENLFRF